MPKSADTEPDTKQRGGSRDYAGEVRWTILDLKDIADAYWATVAPDLAADGFNPETHRPTYEWLVDNSYRNFIYALQEYHNTTVVEFWSKTLEETTTPNEKFNWEVEADTTRRALTDFVDRRLEHDDGFAASSARTYRSRLKRYVITYRAEHGTDDLLNRIRPGNEENLPDETFRVRDVLDTLNRALSERTAYRIYRLVSRWYDNLVQNNQIAANPTGSLGREYGWHQSPPTGSNPTPLSSEHVSALANTAADSREQTMVLGLCAWGLRLSEVASLHRRQLNLETDQPYLSFRERKNGPGEVSILYGEEIARSRINDLMAEEGDWNGYLFPSDRSSTGHRDDDTVRQWFYDLADRAGVPSSIEGDSLKPHMGRRYWYDRYAATMEELFEYARDMADDQGSKSISTIFQRYMEEGRLRSQRREFMRDHLKDAFEG